MIITVLMIAAIIAILLAMIITEISDAMSERNDWE